MSTANNNNDSNLAVAREVICICICSPLSSDDNCYPQSAEEKTEAPRGYLDSVHSEPQLGTVDLSQFTLESKLLTTRYFLKLQVEGKQNNGNDRVTRHDPGLGLGKGKISHQRKPTVQTSQLRKV